MLERGFEVDHATLGSALCAGNEPINFCLSPTCNKKAANPFPGKALKSIFTPHDQIYQKLMLINAIFFNRANFRSLVQLHWFDDWSFASVLSAFQDIMQCSFQFGKFELKSRVLHSLGDDSLTSE